MTDPLTYPHTPAFTAARDALAALLHSPELIEGNSPAVSEALSLTAAATLLTAESHELPPLDVALIPDSQLGAVLGEAYGQLNTYAARKLPAWGSAERAGLIASLAAAVLILDLLAAPKDLGEQV